jgi:hypothetical protein
MGDDKGIDVFFFFLIIRLFYLLHLPSFIVYLFIYLSLFF